MDKFRHDKQIMKYKHAHVWIQWVLEMTYLYYFP